MARDAVSDKVSLLVREGYPQRQAVAMALSMKRSGRLRKGGRYIHKRRRSSSRKGGRR